jgi:hypothetical protein
MLYEFKCKAAGTVVMTGEVAERLLGLVGKAPGPQGIFTVEQMGPAIAALQAAVERERIESAAPPEEPHAPGPEGARAVTLAQRAWPLIDLLRTASGAGKPVTWGV